MGQVILERQFIKEPHVYVLEIFQISHRVKFTCQRYCDRGAIKFLVCHMILQYHVVKGSYDLIS